MFHCKIYSKDYLDDDLSWCVTPTGPLLQRIHSIPGQTSSRWIAALRFGGQEHKIALGSPLVSQTQEQALYFPSWFLDTIGIAHGGEERIVRFEVSERLPKARSLHFKTIGVLPDWLDIVQVLEEPLSQLGVLKMGQMIPVPLIDDAMLILDKYDGEEDFVFMDGSDISLEVEEDHTIPSPPVAEIERDEEQEQEQEQEQEEPMIQNDVQATPPLRSKFIPFEGKGYVLGGR